MNIFDTDDGDPFVTEFRKCQICKEGDTRYVWHGAESGKGYRLVKYGVRHYAHRRCLVERYGDKAQGMVPDHEWRWSVPRPASFEMDGVRFVATGTGHYRSEDGHFVVYHMMRGTVHDSWCLFYEREPNEYDHQIDEMWSLAEIKRHGRKGVFRLADVAADIERVDAQRQENP
jgi:hypothetical protein